MPRLRRRSVLTVASLAVMVVIAPWAQSPSRASRSSIGERGLAYSAYIANDLAIVTSRPNGTYAQVVAEAGQQAVWSPDGDRLAYAFRGEIWQMRANGSRKRRVIRIPNRTLYQPAWSPDGQRLAFGGEWDVIDENGNDETHTAVYVAERARGHVKVHRLVKDAMWP